MPNVFEELNEVWKDEEEYRTLKEALHSKSVEDIEADGFSKEMAETIYECEHGIDVEEVTWEQLMEDIDRCLGSSGRSGS